MIIVAIIALVIILIFILLYNQLIRERNQVNNAFSTVDVILKKRYDLIPNLVETVRGYGEHEKEVFEKVTSLRATAMNSKEKNEVVKLDNEISQGISKLLLLAERYPDLKASNNYLKLQESLEQIENELSAARRTYNAADTEYNISIESFPTNIVSKIFGMKKNELFVIDDSIRKNLKVDL